MQRKTTLLLSFFLLLFTSVFAQPTADFTADVTSGCAPLTVTFEDLSTGTGTLTWDWDFGNGNTSPNENPGAQYSNPGNYTVSLTVTDNTGSDTEVKDFFISVFDSPDIDFVATSDTFGCSPLLVNFQDLSTYNTTYGAPITDWTWIFFDSGGSSNDTNATHIYNNAGLFDISLTIADANGCEDYMIIYDYIEVTPAPVSEFIADPDASCSYPLEVTFSNTSTGSGILTYEWDFGTGDSSIVDSATYIYDTSGLYTATLVVTDGTGCTDTSQAIINVAEITADFDYTDTICPGQSHQFTNTSNGYDNVIWDFGDGSPFSPTDSPTHIYNLPGEYDVILSVYSAAGCGDTITQTIVVEEVVAAFIMDPPQGCLVPLDVSFTDASTNAVSWDYIIYGDTLSAQDTSYTFTAFDTVPVELIATSPHGCKISFIDTITITEPVAHFSIDTTVSDCERLINFTDSSYANDVIVGWDWYFDNNDPSDTSSAQDTSVFFEYNDYIHSNLGVCNVILTITTEEGCTHADTMQINVGIKPTVIFYMYSDSAYETNAEPPLWYDAYYDTLFHSCNNACYAGDTVEDDPCPSDCFTNMFVTCAWPDTLTFFDSSYIAWNGDTIFRDSVLQDSGYIEWHYDFGEPAGESNEQDPIYSYLDADTVGYMDVEFAVSYHNCWDTIITDSMIHVLGPIIRSITAVFDCDSPYVYNFLTDLVSGTEYTYIIREDTLISEADTLIVDTVFFDDDTTLVDTVTYTFPETGDFWFIVEAYNDSTCCSYDDYWYYLDSTIVDTLLHKDSCRYEDSILVLVRDVEAVFMFDTMACANITQLFDGTPSIDAVSYLWTIDGIYNYFPVIAQSFDHHDTTHYTYDVNLAVGAENGCIDDTNHILHVFQPFADFYWDSIDRCIPFDVEFSDTSWWTIPLENYYYYFGEGGYIDSLDPVYTYDTNGLFDVTYIVMDTLGCLDTIIYPELILTSQPYPDFVINDTTVCFGDSTLFTSTSIGTLPTSLLEYLWYFGDGDSLTGDSAIHVYQDTGFYSPQLVLSENFGCTVDTIMLDEIYVQKPNAQFHPSDTVTNCQPFDVIFYSDDSTGYIETYIWNMEDGVSFPGDSVQSWQYVLPGVYYVSLDITTTFGCTDSYVFDDSLVVGGPYATLSISDDSVCIHDTITLYMNDTSSVMWWRWDDADGNLIANVNPLQISYDKIGTIFPGLTVYSTPFPDDDCGWPIYDSVYVLEVKADFTMNNMIGCETLDVFFEDSSVYDVPYLQWSINGVPETNADSWNHTFSDTGTYVISLHLTDQGVGCQDTASQVVTIYPNPVIDIMNDTIICPETTITLWGIEADSVIWFPSEFIADSSLNETELTPDYTETYIYTIYDFPIDSNYSFSCSSDTSVTVEVFEEFGFQISDDTTMFVGESAHLFIEPEYPVDTFIWSPAHWLSCINCQYPIASPEQTIVYYVTFEDSVGCAIKEASVEVTVLEVEHVGVPSAFTPNGDGKNDYVMIRGNGIKELVEFSIYNRWGEMVFTTDDLNSNGWDGTHMKSGKPQNIDTYSYIFKVQFYTGTITDGKGNIHLIR